MLLIRYGCKIVKGCSRCFSSGIYGIGVYIKHGLKVRVCHAKIFLREYIQKVKPQETKCSNINLINKLLNIFFGTHILFSQISIVEHERNTKRTINKHKFLRINSEKRTQTQTRHSLKKKKDINWQDLAKASGKCILQVPFSLNKLITHWARPGSFNGNYNPSFHFSGRWISPPLSCNETATSHTSDRVSLLLFESPDAPNGGNYVW